MKLALHDHKFTSLWGNWARGMIIRNFSISRRRNENNLLFEIHFKADLGGKTPLEKEQSVLISVNKAFFDF